MAFAGPSDGAAGGRSPSEDAAHKASDSGAGAHTFLSVALGIPARLPAGYVGHKVAYHRALTQAAERRVSLAAVVVPGRTNVRLPGLISLDVGAESGGWAVGLHRLFDDRGDAQTTVVIYEGDQEALGSVCRLASLHPRVVFILNLFRSDAALAFPHLSERSIVQRLNLVRGATTPAPDATGASHTNDMPPNVVVYADTARRALLARSIGVREVRAWPLYSVLEPAARARPVTGDGVIRVVIPIAGWQVTRQLVYEIAIVVQLCRRYAAPGQRFDWYIFGGGYDGEWLRRARARLVARLRSLGVRFDSMGLSTEEYARAFADADVVWFPKRGFYTTQSSGKAADALVSGAPVLAPNGSYPAQEQERWVPGAPAYTGAREAVEILLRSATVWPTLRAQMAEQRDQIRWWYSPERAVDEILTTAAETRERLSGTDHAGGNTPASEGPPPRQPVEARPRRQVTRVERVARRTLTHFRASMSEARVRCETLFRIR